MYNTYFHSMRMHTRIILYTIYMNMILVQSDASVCSTKCVFYFPHFQSTFTWSFEIVEQSLSQFMFIYLRKNRLFYSLLT